MALNFSYNLFCLSFLLLYFHGMSRSVNSVLARRIMPVGRMFLSRMPVPAITAVVLSGVFAIFAVMFLMMLLVMMPTPPVLIVVVIIIGMIAQTQADTRSIGRDADSGRVDIKIKRLS